MAERILFESDVLMLFNDSLSFAEIYIEDTVVKTLYLEVPFLQKWRWMGVRRQYNFRD